jgi:hypothetical protein
VPNRTTAHSLTCAHAGLVTDHASRTAVRDQILPKANIRLQSVSAIHWKVVRHTNEDPNWEGGGCEREV